MHTQEIAQSVLDVQRFAELAREAYDAALETGSIDLHFEAILLADECGERCFPSCEIPQCLNEIPELRKHWHEGWGGMV